ncbi:apolipoprotein L3-like isoform X1 [Pelobates fuscus]|uniref:apolipoprotein L3-like isoform X1 n=1 Tax=Pelobates fuscus TaxID=191477 RepID=UPI002FE493A7
MSGMILNEDNDESASQFAAEVRLTFSEYEEKILNEDNDESASRLSAEVMLKFSENEEKVKKRLEEFDNLQHTVIQTFEKCINELCSIAADIDHFHKGAVTANIVGSSVGIAGGVAAIAGLALAPFTFGASLTVSAIGVGAATAGGVTGAIASIADNVHTKNKCKEVERILEYVNEEKEKMQEMLKEIDALITDMKSLLGVDNVDLARLSGRGVYTVAEVARVIQLVKLSTTAAQGASLVARGARVAAAVSGIFAALFLVVDIANVVNSAKELGKGAKSEEAKKIREVADELEKEIHNLKSKEAEFRNCKTLLF